MGPILAPGGAGVRGGVVGILATSANEVGVAVGGGGVSVSVAVAGGGTAVGGAVTVGGAGLGVVVGASAVGAAPVAGDSDVGLPGRGVGLEIGDRGVSAAGVSPTTIFIIVAVGLTGSREGLSVARTGVTLWPG